VAVLAVYCDGLWVLIINPYMDTIIILKASIVLCVSPCGRGIGVFAGARSCQTVALLISMFYMQIPVECG
jgi:hypothetical protein